MLNLNKVFQKYEEEYCQFQRIPNPPSNRPDLCAFIMLDNLIPNPDFYIVSWAGHDEIALDIDCEELAKIATEEFICDLVRCGVRYDSNAYLKMYV